MCYSIILGKVLAEEYCRVDSIVYVCMYVCMLPPQYIIALSVSTYLKVWASILVCPHSRTIDGRVSRYFSLPTSFLLLTNTTSFINHEIVIKVDWIY